MMIMMTMKKMTVILTNHIACHSRSEGKPQGQCNQAFQLKRIILLSQKVKRKKKTAIKDNGINDGDDGDYDLMFDDATC